MTKSDPSNAIQQFMGSACIRCTISDVRAIVNWGRTENVNDISASEKISLRGHIIPSFHRPQLDSMECQINFYPHSAASQLADDEYGDPNLGYMEYLAGGSTSDLVFFGIPCTNEYFRKVQHICGHWRNHVGNSMSVEFSVNNMTEEWKSQEPPVGEPNLWIKHVEITIARRLKTGAENNEEDRFETEQNIKFIRSSLLNIEHTIAETTIDNFLEKIEKNREAHDTRFLNSLSFTIRELPTGQWLRVAQVVLLCLLVWKLW